MPVDRLGNPALEKNIKKRRQGMENLETESTEKLKGSPPVQRAHQKKIKREKSRGKVDNLIKGVQADTQAYTQADTLTNNEKLRKGNISTGNKMAKVRTPSKKVNPPSHAGEKKFVSMKRRTFWFDWVCLKLLKVYPRYMGLSVGEFLRRAITSYIESLKSEGINPNER